MPRHGGIRTSTAQTTGAFLALLLCSGNGQASVDACSADVVLADSDAGTLQVALSVRLLDGTGKAHERTARAGDSRVTFEDVGCGPSTLEVVLPADPETHTLDEPLRLARQLLDFDDRGHANAEIPIPAIRSVRCRVVDKAGKPVSGGTVAATPASGDGLSSIAIGARIQNDGFGELLLTKDKHRVTYGDDDNFLTKPTTIDGQPTTSEFVHVDDSKMLIEFVTSRSTPRIAVTGTVVDPDGAGIPGIEIQTTAKHSKTAESNEVGQFLLKVPGPQDTITLQASDRSARWVFDPVTIDLEHEPDELKWVARPWLGSRIGIRVIKSDSGEPIAKAHLMADLECLGDAPTRLISLLTDEDGRFDIPCSPGCPSTVDIYPYWSESPEYFHEQGIAVPSNACGDSWTLRLERGTRISGTVVDSHGHGVSGLSLKLVRDGDASVTEWTTGPDGSYSFHPLSPGRYRVQLHEVLEWGQDRFLYLASDSEPLSPLPVVEVSAQQDVRLNIVAATGGMVCVEGVQTPDDVGPLPITWLYVVSADASDAANGRMYDLRHNRSPKGGCTLGLPAGEWRLTAGTYFSEQPYVIPAWSGTDDPAGPAAYSVTPGKRTLVRALPGQLAGGLSIGLRDYELAMTDAITAEISSRREGNAAPDAWVPVPSERFRMAATEPDGAIRVFMMLPPGDYKLRLRTRTTEESKAGIWISEAYVAVVAGENTEVTLKRSSFGSS